MNAVEVRDLRLVYPGQGQPALDGVTLSVASGEFAGLLGPNGAGKTTLMSVLCGLLRPGSGSARLFGEEPGSEAVKRQTGLCPQDLSLYLTLTARENLRLFGRLAGLGAARLKQRIDEVLQMTGLVDNADRRVERFSGGMKRRLNLGIAVLHEPRLLLLDEPTVGVDPQSRRLIFDSLERLNHAGATLIYTTHYMEEAERMCRTIFVIDQGRVLASGDHASLTGGGRISLEGRFMELTGRQLRD
ncbi:MAG TPA: ABC transporter ATP-binding protein [Candidatus Polarisedimenticolia bacterium]